MELEWLETVAGIIPDKLAARRNAGARNLGNSRFRSFLKLVAAGDRKNCLNTLQVIISDDQLGQFKKKAAVFLCTPYVYSIARFWLALHISLCSHKKHSSLIELIEGEIPFFWEEI